MIKGLESTLEIELTIELRTRITWMRDISIEDEKLDDSRQWMFTTLRLEGGSTCDVPSNLREPRNCLELDGD